MKKVLTVFDEFGFRSLRERARSVLTKSSGLASLGSESPDFAMAPEPALEEIPPKRLAEAQVMLWLISSEFTNPSLDDILAFTKERTFDGAYTVLTKQLAALGRVKEVYEKIERPLIPVARAMGERGVLVDTKVLADLKKHFVLHSVSRSVLEKISEDKASNNAGGILGGISTGSDILLRAAVKPTPSISFPQKTVDLQGKAREIRVEGRHDPCICPRIIPVAEGMAALVLADHLLRNRYARLKF